MWEWRPTERSRGWWASRPGCAAVSTIGAIAIGAICGAAVVGSIWLLERVRVDDPVSAVSVHGTCGVLGTLLVGLFATETGLFYGGGTDQLVTQAIGVVAVVAWVAVTAGVLFAVLKATIGLRVTAEEEHMGLDLHEHGARGYNPEIYTADFVIEAGDEMVPISELASVNGGS